MKLLLFLWSVQTLHWQQSQIHWQQSQIHSYVLFYETSPFYITWDFLTQQLYKLFNQHATPSVISNLFEQGDLLKMFRGYVEIIFVQRKSKFALATVVWHVAVRLPHQELVPSAKKRQSQQSRLHQIKLGWSSLKAQTSQNISRHFVCSELSSILHKTPNLQTENWEIKFLVRHFQKTRRGCNSECSIVH